MPIPSCQTVGSPTYTETSVSGISGQCTSKIGTSATTRPDQAVIAYVDLTLHPGVTPSPSNANGVTVVAGFGITTTGTGASTVYHWGPGTFGGLTKGHTYRFCAFAHNSAGWSAADAGFTVTPSGLPSIQSAAFLNEMPFGPYWFGQQLTLNFNVTDNGGKPIIERGIIWCSDEGADQNVTLTYGAPADRSKNNNDPANQTGAAVGVIPAGSPTLQAGHAYKIRAFVRTANTVNPAAVYAPVIHFTLPPAPPPDRSPLVILTTTPQGIGPHTVHADGRVTDVGIHGGQGDPGVISDAGFIWTTNAAVAASDSAFRIGQPNVVRVATGPPDPILNYSYSATFDVTATVLPHSEVEGGTRVYVRAYATNGATGYGDIGSTPLVRTPIAATGMRGFAVELASKSDPIIAAGSTGHVVAVGFCDVHFEEGTPSRPFFPMFDDPADVGPHFGIESDGYLFEDPRMLFEQDSDPLCTHATRMPLSIVPQLEPLIVVRAVLAGFGVDIETGVEGSELAGVGKADRGLYLSSAILGTAPLGRAPARRLHDDGRIIRSGAVASVEQPPPPPPPPPPPGQPSAPKHVFARATDSSVTVTWDANAANEHIDHYRAYIRQGTSGPYTPTTVPSGTSHTFGGLPASTAFQVFVTAVDNHNLESDGSALVSISTLAAGQDIVLPIGDASDTIDGTGKFDGTGTHDVSDDLHDWIVLHVPNGTSATSMTRLVIPKINPSTGQRTKLKVEGGLNAGVRVIKQWVKIDGEGSAVAQGADGAQLFALITRPFVVQVTPGHDPSDPSDSWDLVYRGITPHVVAQTYTGGSGGTALSRAQNQCDGHNRTRDILNPQLCFGLLVEGVQLTGPYDQSGYNSGLEAQDGIAWEGCVDCGVRDSTIELMWGNGHEGTQHGAGGSAVHTSGVWMDNCAVRNFGRQSMSLSDGDTYIIENSHLAGSARTLIDCEPGGQNLVSEVHILNNSIGNHGLGMMSLHPGVSRVRVAGNRGTQISTAGICYAEYVIFENNVETDGDVSSYAYQFARAAADHDTGPGNPGNSLHVDFGGQHIIVRNNRNSVHTAAASFRALDLPSSQYSVLNNRDRSGGLLPNQYDDFSSPPWSGAFVPFTLPIPAHALRDALGST